MLNKISTDEQAALIQQLSQAIVFVDTALKIVYVSDRWLIDFNLSREEVIGKSVVAVLNIADSIWAKSIRKACKNEVSNQGLENFRDAAGREHWFEWRHNPWYNSQAKAVGTIIEFVDITETIFDNIKIEQFEELLKDSSEHQKIGSWEYDAIQDKFTFCPITAALFGSTGEDESGIGPILKFFKKGDSQETLKNVLALARNKGVPWSEHLYVVDGNGGEIPVVTAGTPIFKENDFLGYVGTITDISQRLINEQKSLAKDQIFQSIFNSSYQFTGILDVDGTFLEINNTALKFAELQREDIVGKKFWEAYWWKIPDEIIGALKLMVHKAASGETMRTEITAYDRKKRPVPVDFSLKPIRDANQKVISLIAEGRMIHEMVRTREELRMNERQFRALYELSPVGYVLSQFHNGLILDINPAFCDLTGYDKSAIGALKYSQIMKVAESDWPPKFIEDLKHYGVFGPVEHTLYKQDGTPYPALISASIITNRRSKKYVWTVIQDLSDIKAKEKQMEEDRLLLRTLIDNLPLNVFVKDLDSRKILVNKSELNFCGMTEESEMIGKDDFDLYDKATAMSSRNEDIMVMKSDQSMISKETINVKPDGSKTYFITSKIPLKDAGGKVIGLIGLSMDITNIKQKEKELNDLIEITSDQNKKLITFAHIVSHDLRSHTANFSMLLDFLEKEGDPEERSRILSMMTDASDNLLDTLKSLNEVVEISTNINVEKKAIPLYSRIVAAAQNLGGLIKQTKTKIIIDIPEDATVRAVPAYLDSILVNFITNAVKYKHPDRAPEIRMTLDKEGDYLVLGIQDNGSGIDLDRYGKKIFGMYKTFHNNTDARGIGLYLTKNQIEAMNGKVEVQSKVGNGSLFKIYFNEKN